VKFFFPINLLRILRAATNVGKRYFRKTLWKYVHTCGRKFSRKTNGTIHCSRSGDVPLFFA
jgi:hypothetical protein